MTLVAGAALVAGAGPGVSGHLARLLADEGHPLVLLGIDQDVLDELAAYAGAAGVACESAVVDLTDDPAVRAVVAELVGRVGEVALVHFNPSAWRQADPLTLTPAGLAEDVALGVGALLSVVQAARPAMASGARVSVTGSMAADRPWHEAASLGVQKAAVRNLVHSLDATLQPSGIRAVSVTVRGTLAEEGPFSHGAVARAIRAALDQDDASWRSEVPYSG
ncbi:SDR family oxidoreductase [Nocardioides aequoreus]|uniref:SDR family oxidoreductase n=1 Tax=Nocardioides aequoreus TaxID=397278 RepID=UPI0004C45374|nr:SDR family oxidoreductase [Nocardioides aequoreus]